MSKYQRQLKGQSTVRIQGQIERRKYSKESAEKILQRIEGDKIDSLFGFDRLNDVSSLHLNHLNILYINIYTIYLLLYIYLIDVYNVLNMHLI
jgi:hypothetical protein